MTESPQELASRWKRLGGSVLDTIVQLAIVFPVMAFAGIFRQLAQDQPISSGQRVFFFFFGLAVFLAINGYLLAKGGQTVGKKLVGTRIVSNKGEYILPLSRIFGLRYLPISVLALMPVVGNVLCVVDVLFIFREDRRCIHDLIAGTKVINT